MTGCLSSSPSSDSSAPRVRLDYDELVRDFYGEIVRTCLDVEAVSNVFADEDGPRVSSYMLGAVTTLSFSGLVSNAGGLPASLLRGTAAGTFSPLLFLLPEAKGSSLGFF